MAVVSYTAKRSLVSGVSVNDTVVLDISPREPFNREREVNRQTHQSLDFTTETIYHAGRVLWPITTLMLNGADADAMVMFLDSVEDGQVFSFAPFDASTDSPIDYRNVVASAGYVENREVSVGDDANDEKSYSFVLAEVP